MTEEKRPEAGMEEPETFTSSSLPAPATPTVEVVPEAIETVVVQPKSIPDEIQSLQVAALQDILAMRRRWSQFLLGVLAFEVVSTFGIVISTGLGWLQLPQWTLETYLIKFVGEVIGLPMVVVKFLFREEDRQVR
jgi:hypothetical protein